MRSERIKKTLVISMIVLLVGASMAFAQGRNWGDRAGRMMGPGAGMGPGYGYGPRGVNLTDEQRAALSAARDGFHAETQQLRDQIREKRWALRDEMAKSNPDAAVARALQNELAQLEGVFNEKALEHRLEVRQILPDEAVGYGFGRGKGRGGHGGYGGYCLRD
jgi:zinc resistance-associated protein